MIPNHSNVAFRDVKSDDPDFEKNVSFIMEKVFNYGLWADQVAVINFYGRA